MIEIKKYTNKIKLWAELTDLIWKGKKLTFIYGIGQVNEKDNNYFLDLGEYIVSNNYLEYIDNNHFTRKNKIMDRMTQKEIKEKIFTINKIVSLYANMNEFQRLTMAVSTRMTQLNNLKVKYYNKLENEKPEHKYIYHNAIANINTEILKIENKLMQAQQTA